MLFSLYPTDSPQVREAVIEQVLTQPEKLLFTSLHIPESDGLLQYGEYLGELHRDHGVTFCGDVSPPPSASSASRWTRSAGCATGASPACASTTASALSRSAGSRRTSRSR